MTDYTKLIEALRILQDKNSFSYYKRQVCKDAADAIEELQDEVDKANKSADAYRAMYFTKHGDITIEKVRELDEIDCYFHSALIRLMYKRIEELDAEENSRIVRCGECKHTKNDGCGAIYCMKWDRWEMPEDFFCAYGERAEVQE